MRGAPAPSITLEQIQEYMRRQSEEDKKNRTITVEAENIPEALKKASIELALPLRGLEYEVLQKGSPGTMGIGRKPWKLAVSERSKEVKTRAELEEEARARPRNGQSVAEEKPKDLPGRCSCASAARARS